MRNSSIETSYWRCYSANDSYVLELLGFSSIVGGLDGARAFFAVFAVSADLEVETFLAGAGLAWEAATGVGLVSTAGLSAAFGEAPVLGLAVPFMSGLTPALGFAFSGTLSAASGAAATTDFVGAFGSITAMDLATALDFTGTLRSNSDLGLAGTSGSTFALDAATDLAIGTTFRIAVFFCFVESSGLEAVVFPTDMLTSVGALTAPDVLD